MDTSIEEIRQARARIIKPPWFNWNSLEWKIQTKDLLSDNDTAAFIVNAPEYVDFLLSEIEKLQNKNLD